MPLKFEEYDLVYGPKAAGKLRELQKKAGGNLLEDVIDPYDDEFNDWLSRSIGAIRKYTRKGYKVRFDLTHMVDINNVLNGVGKYANAITAGELRYIRDNWRDLKDSVVFYINNREVQAPWLN